MSEITVRAKFKINSFTDFGNSCRQFKLTAIYGKEGENFGFSKYTPFGNLELNVIDETYAAQNWKIGDEFYLDFHKVPKP